MKLHVQKYGGTSLATTERIQLIADRIVRTRATGARVVVVVSAMGGTTDQLLELAHQVSHRPTARELDMLLTAGERISMALLSMALHERGESAISFTGSQSGILTDTWHGTARIREIRATRLLEALENDRIVIVAGFQGVSAEREVTTLGRGGSDTTAVALAVTLQADRCDICTDVQGVYSADPRRVPQARLLSRISYEEMLAMALHGARVLHPRATEMAGRFQVALRVCSSIEEGGGTIVGSSEGLEPARIQGVTCDQEVAQVRVVVPHADSAICAELLSALSQSGLVPREMSQSTDADRTQVVFLVGQQEATQVEAIVQNHFEGQAGVQISLDTEVALLAVVGHALQTPGVASQVLSVLAQHRIALQRIQSSSIALAGIVRRTDTTRALQILHEQIGSSADEVTD